MMLGLWLTAAFYACFVWKWMHFRNAIGAPMVGSFVVPNSESMERFHQEIHQSEMLFMGMWLAFLVNVAANLIGQIPKRMSGRNRVLAAGVDALWTWVCLTWLFIFIIGIVL